MGSNHFFQNCFSIPKSANKEMFPVYTNEKRQEAEEIYVGMDDCFNFRGVNEHTGGI